MCDVLTNHEVQFFAHIMTSSDMNLIVITLAFQCSHCRHTQNSKLAQIERLCVHYGVANLLIDDEAVRSAFK